MVVADAEFRGGADHPVRDVPVGLPGGDLEPAGQVRAGQCQRHPVTGREVDRPADHAALRGVVRGAGAHLAVADRLLEPGELLDRGDLGDHDAVDVVPDLLDGLDLQAGRGEPPGHLGRVGGGVYPSGGQQPGQWDAHQASIPNARLNRTSPSRVSRMSVTPCRTMRVRSMPSPNAKPL